MAQEGEYKLTIKSITDLYAAVLGNQETYIDAYYQIYKKAFILSNSIHFRGDSADAMKDYMQKGCVNIVTGMMDMISELSMISQTIAATLCQYECRDVGKVYETELTASLNTLSSNLNDLVAYESDLTSLCSQAEDYIATTNLPLGDVYTQYSNTSTTIDKIKSDLETADGQLKPLADELYNRIIEMKTMVQKIAGYYDASSRLNLDGITNDLDGADWYVTETNSTLALKKQEDPFEYVSGETSMSEDQWAIGLYSDVYAYAGYQAVGANGEYGIEDGTAFARGCAYVLNANAYAQFTDYAKAEGSVKLGYVSGEARWNDEEGFYVGGEVDGARAQGSVVLGTDNVNAFLKGDAKVLSADGKVACEFKDDGEFSFGFDGNASLASAKGTAGFSLMSYYEKDKDMSTDPPTTLYESPKSLLNASISAKANAGGSAAIYAESKTAIEGDYVNINATSLKLDLSLFVGVTVNFTVPTLYFHF